MIVPPQNTNQLHVLEIPTVEDIRNLVDNRQSPENFKMLDYWRRIVEEKANSLGVFLPIWDDAIFLGAIEWDWFLQELAFSSYQVAHKLEEKEEGR